MTETVGTMFDSRRQKFHQLMLYLLLSLLFAISIVISCAMHSKQKIPAHQKIASSHTPRSGSLSRRTTVLSVVSMSLHCFLCQSAIAEDLERGTIKVEKSNGVVKLIFDSKTRTPGVTFLQSRSPIPGELEPVFDETDLPDSAPLLIPEGESMNPSPIKLKGAVHKSGKHSDLKKLNASESKVLSPGSSSLDGQISADAAREEVSIEWDRWRNKLSKAIWAKFCNHLQGGDTINFGNYYWKYGNNPPLKFPDNTRATYSVTVDSDMNVVEAKITKSSGIAKFDEIVRRSAESVNRKRMLKFPAGSKRKQVTLSLQLFTTKHGGFKDIDFNDVERYTASSEGTP